MKYLSLVLIVLLSGCATADKALTPVDQTSNSIESGYTNTSNYVSEGVDGMSDGIDNIKSSYYENGFIQLFCDDKTTIKNREKYFVKWDNTQKYNLNRILGRKQNRSMNDYEKMKALKNHFFTLYESNFKKEFKSKNPKPKFDSFSTDRENINNIHAYNMKVLDSKHQWDLQLNETKKEVASSMFCALYGKAKVVFKSYDPDDEEIYLSIKSTNGEFEQKIKFEVEKELAREISKNIRRVTPEVFFKFDNDILEYVGINIKYNNKTYLTKSIDITYQRQSSIAFVANDYSLKDLNIDYATSLSNITPPSWYREIDDAQRSIGYGEGVTESEAKNNAFEELAQLRHTSVDSSITMQTKRNSANNVTSSTQHKAKIKSNANIKNSKIIKSQKKDGIWFMAIVATS